MIKFLDTKTRVHQPLRQFAVVGEQDQAGGIEIQASNRKDSLLFPQWFQKLGDIGTLLRIVEGGDESGRFV